MSSRTGSARSRGATRFSVMAPGDLLLLVFVHGFKGTDKTFGDFPDRLRHILSETIPDSAVESVIFPAYETKGELNEAVVRFSDWLTTLTVEKEVAHGGAGKAKIVLCGHSMGGILTADTLQEFVNGRPDADAPLWPKIVACIAFDTPYLGLNPNVFKDSATKAIEYAKAASSVGAGFLGALSGIAASRTPSPQPQKQQQPAAASGWPSWAGSAAAAVGGAVLAGAAAGATYYKREELAVSFTWATDHMKYVGNLWDAAALNKRLEKLVASEEKEGIVFRNFYTFLPPTPMISNAERTFCVLPRKSSPAGSRFIMARNGIAANEVDAHTGMFSAKTNDGYYDLGLEAAKAIRSAVFAAREGSNNLIEF
uniref:DUF676 domain-containing protein n=1 Tax=Mycena chlorophos TaxID=658473 RepID=A0ABQ0M4J9_MYCCL|nr:predicted protein [Mycena chlorophos]